MLSTRGLGDGAWTAAITAGGRSARFGSDKALARLEGHTLLERVAGSLKGATSRFLIAPEGKYSLEGWTVIPDTRPGEGPLAGLEAALRHAPRGWVAFAGVDMPFLTPTYWATLWQARTPEALAVQARREGHPHPLGALYHTDLLPRVMALLDSGERRLRLAAPAGQTVHVSGVDAQALRNINVPQDLVFGDG